MEVIDIYGCKNFSANATFSGTKSLSAYPNPASATFSLKIDEETQGKTVVSIINSSGIKVMEYQAENISDDCLEEIPVSNLDEGIYVVQVLLNNKELYYTKIVVIK